MYVAGAGRRVCREHIARYEAKSKEVLGPTPSALAA